MNTSSPQYAPQELPAAFAASAPLLLDVREYPEYAAGHLKGARLIPLTDIEKRASELPKNQPILCICWRSGRPSAEAASPLAPLGFANVSQLAGGVGKDRAAARKRGARVVGAGAAGAVRRGTAHPSRAGHSPVWPAALALAWVVPYGLAAAALTDSCGMREAAVELTRSDGVFSNKSITQWINPARAGQESIRRFRVKSEDRIRS